MWLRLLVDFAGDPAGTITCAADPVAQVLIAGGVAEECSPPRCKPSRDHDAENNHGKKLEDHT